MTEIEKDEIARRAKTSAQNILSAFICQKKTE